MKKTMNTYSNKFSNYDTGFPNDLNLKSHEKYYTNKSDNYTSAITKRYSMPISENKDRTNSYKLNSESKMDFNFYKKQSKEEQISKKKELLRKSKEYSSKLRQKFKNKRK